MDLRASASARRSATSRGGRSPAPDAGLGSRWPTRPGELYLVSDRDAVLEREPWPEQDLALGGGGFDLGQHFGHECLAAETGDDGHAEQQVDGAEEGQGVIERGGRVDREPGEASGGTDAAQSFLHVVIGLGVDGDHVRAGIGADGVLQISKLDRRRIGMRYWNADGGESVGIYRPTTTRFYFRFTNTPGNADAELDWGEPAWLPVAGAMDR